MPILNIDNAAVVTFTNKLEKLHRSALPVAIRGTLNNAAFDVKQNTMPSSASASFTERRKNFFKANSSVDMAKGFDVNNMKAVVGFVSTKLKGNNFAIRNLEQQELGGTIKKKSFIPTDKARGGNPNKNVRPSNRLSRIHGIIDTRKVKGRSEGARFNRAVATAGKGGYVLAEHKGKTILWRVNSANKTKGGRWRLTALYSFKQGRDVGVTPTFFMRKASLQSGDKINRFFIEQAKRQIQKVL